MTACKMIRGGAVAGLAVLGIFGFQLAVATGLAGAFTGYGSPVYFGTAGSGSGEFNEPAGVAVDESTKEVYVYDSGNLRVERFNSTGDKFEGQFNGSGLLAGEGSAAPTGRFAPPASVSKDAAHGTLFNLAVDNASASPSKGDVYVVDPGHNVIDKFTATGAYLSQLTGFKLPVFGVAVDTTGNVWVAEEGTEERGEPGVGVSPVQEFDNAVVNKHVTELSPIGLRSPGIALDSEQNLYLPQEGANVAKFNKEGTFLGQVTEGGSGTALAIDTSSNDLFFDRGKSISRYLPNTEPPPAETFTGVSGSDGVAVNAETSVVYASQLGANTVALFNFSLFPDVTTGSAGAVTRTTAKLEGEVNPDGQEVTSCEFEYGPTEAYGNTVPCSSSPGSGTSTVTVSAEAAGLTAGSAYHFRLIAGNSNGKHPGKDAELTTPPAVENVLTEAPAAFTASTATLQGSFEPNGFETHYRFEYLSLEAFVRGTPGSLTALQDGGSASEDVHVSAEATGLTPNALILFRIVAENKFGQTLGGFSAFKTPVTAPVIPGAPSAPFIAAHSAVLNADLNPENTTTHYHFQYAPCPTIENCPTKLDTSEEESALNGAIGTSAEIVELKPSTTYSYRLVASNEFEEEGKTLDGKATGSEGTFTTTPAPAPSVSSGVASGVGVSTATISGSVDPDGAPTSYSFELGVYEGASTRFGVVSSGSAGAGTVPVQETLGLSGLQPDGTYAFRIAIRSGYIDNSERTLQSAPVVFTTSGVPSVLALPAIPGLLPIPAIAFPTEAPGASTTITKTLTRAQKLTAALKTCKKEKSKSKRAKCEKTARKSYGPAQPARKKKKGAAS